VSRRLVPLLRRLKWPFLPHTFARLICVWIVLSMRAILHSSPTLSLSQVCASSVPGLRKQSRVRHLAQPRRILRVDAFWHASTAPEPLAQRYFSKMAQRFQKARRSPNGETSVSRVYPDANTKAAREYWEYENLTVSWGCVPASRNRVCCHLCPFGRCTVGVYNGALDLALARLAVARLHQILAFLGNHTN
jgi:hypothetical protein